MRNFSGMDRIEQIKTNDAARLGIGRRDSLLSLGGRRS
jgi:hypothetical protein